MIITFSNIGEMKDRVNTHGIDKVSFYTGYDRGRILDLISSNLHKSHNIKNLLEMSRDQYEDSLYNLKIYDKLYKQSLKNKKKEYENKYSELKSYYENFATKKLIDIKTLLKSKNNINSKILLLAIEIEETSILAKHNWRNKNKLYSMKEKLILSLIKLFDNNGLNWGFGESDLNDINSIVYFDSPAGQLSWHTMIEIDSSELYDKEWINHKDSTMRRLENYIYKNYICD